VVLLAWGAATLLVPAPERETAVPAMPDMPGMPGMPNMPGMTNMPGMAPTPTASSRN
jgi:hypothetical protein